MIQILVALAGHVRREDTATINQGVVVCLAVFFVEVTPIAGDVAGQELTCVLTGIPKGFKGTRRGDDPAELRTSWSH